MKSYLIYQTEEGEYTLEAEGNIKVAAMKAKNKTIAKETIDNLNKALRDDV